jgi:membrane fusion protein (multidrug efflux system)
MWQDRYSILLVALLALIAGCEKEPAAAGRGAWGGAANVVTRQVQLQPMVDEIQALGTARANESVEIQPRVSSLIERVLFTEGQLVNQGDLLIELENSEIVAGLAVAEASLSDRARLDNTVIRAPFSGRVGLRRVSPGSFVNSSTVITTLDDVDTIKLDFSVPETFFAVLSEGMNIAAHSLVYPERVFSGTVASIDTRVDPVSRAVQVRAIIPNADGALKPGMFLSVDLQRDRGEQLLAPEQAIVPEGNNQYVFVVADGVAEKRAVQLGRRIPGFVIIDSGLAPGEAVITEGTHRVRDGSKVQAPGQASADNSAGPGRT